MMVEIEEIGFCTYSESTRMTDNLYVNGRIKRVELFYITKGKVGRRERHMRGALRQW